jgi:GT2 family glycosyltransferase
MQLSGNPLKEIPLSAVIPTYGGSKDLEALLSSVKPDKKTHEVIVVDRRAILSNCMEMTFYC